MKNEPRRYDILDRKGYERVKIRLKRRGTCFLSFVFILLGIVFLSPSLLDANSVKIIVSQGEEWGFAQFSNIWALYGNNPLAAPGSAVVALLGGNAPTVIAWLGVVAGVFAILAFITSLVAVTSYKKGVIFFSVLFMGLAITLLFVVFVYLLPYIPYLIA